MEILLKAKEVGLLASIKPELKGLQERGFSVSETIIRAVLHEAKELE
ncbi:MAG: DUF3368 domain-containing protein [Anaerolineales bacterium]|nr:DUF3368 domain-containing protein [Anaerolineales bacterium]